MSAKSDRESPKAKMTDFFSKTPVRSASLNRLDKRLRSPENDVREEKKHKLDDTMCEMLQSLNFKFDKFEQESKQQQQQNSEILGKLDKIQTSLVSFDSRISTIENKSETNKCEIDAIKVEIASMRTEMDTIKVQKASEVSNQQILHMQAVICAQAKLVKQEARGNTAYSQRHNLIFDKVPERRDEDCKTLISRIIEQHMGLNGAYNQIDKAHRMGPSRQSQVRPIIVRFKTHNAKEVTYQHRRLLAGTGYFVNLHLDDKTRRENTLISRIEKLAKDKDPQSHRLSGNRIRFKNNVYSLAQLRKGLCNELPVHELNQRSTENVTGFFGELSPLSNFHQVDIEIEGRQYPHVEKFYQLKKAELCGDITSIARINLEDDPAVIKQISKDIRTPEGTLPSFEEETLDSIMLTGLRAKFRNSRMKAHLLATGTKHLAECSKDKYYGIGSMLHEGNWRDPSKWAGQNKLGILLTKVRNEIKAS